MPSQGESKQVSDYSCPKGYVEPFLECCKFTVLCISGRHSSVVRQGGKKDHPLLGWVCIPLPMLSCMSAVIGDFCYFRSPYLCCANNDVHPLGMHCHPWFIRLLTDADTAIFLKCLDILAIR